MTSKPSSDPPHRMLLPVLLLWTTTAALFAGAAMYRTLVGLHPFSGQNNYHGQKAAYGGDFEAQRHWMEITWNLKSGIGAWYWYDLQYWGLDYPPLTAYVSYLLGGLSHYLVGPESVALDTSRGYEQHKSFMRGTVLVTDLAIYGTAVWAWSCRRRRRRQQLQQIQIQQYGASGTNIRMIVAAFVLPMLHPAMVLIDHGHFQYNTTALGLCLWCFYYLTNNNYYYYNHTPSNGKYDYYYAAIWFCLALNFKQMTLYYAPAVFFYLLGDCWSQPRPMVQFIVLGSIVITIFAILWWPFVFYDGPVHTSPMDRFLHIVRRIFPFARGLFEGKVANMWCVLSIRPIRIRERIPPHQQPLGALILTTIAILPACLRLFQLGRWQRQRHHTNNNHNNNHSVVPQQIPTHHSSSLLLWGMTNCALAFFLASFQVHEKSILMALAPASLLLVGRNNNPDQDDDDDHDDDTLPFLRWLALFGTWTLWPLLKVDRLQTAYFCTMLIFVVALVLQDELLLLNNNKHRISPSPPRADGIFWRISRTGFYILAVLLHGLELMVTPPQRLPDLFPVLWSFVGCAGLSMAYLYSILQLYSTRQAKGKTS